MSGSAKLKTYLLLAAFSLTIVSSAMSRTIYVDANATGTNDGTSWTDAFNYLQDALADANYAVKPVEIRVAQGTYRPDENTFHPDGTGDRTATFQLMNGVTLKGGYAGFDEPDPNAWDIEEYETIISGDLAVNDVEVVDLQDLLKHPSRLENSYHVVTGSDTDSNAVLDGLTITAGNAWPPPPPPPYIYLVGGGILNIYGSPTIKNCIFIRNSSGSGAGMYNDHSNPTVIRCAFNENSAGTGGNGGGIYNYRSRPILTNCSIRDNLSNKDGGGIFCFNSSPKIANCTIAGNSTGHDGRGGGIFCYSSSNPSISHCDIIGNSADSFGGGIYCYLYSNPKLTNCTIRLNSGYRDGGGIFCDNSNPTITNCTITGNSATKWPQGCGGGIYCLDSSSPAIINCTISGNSSGNYGGGIFVDYCICKPIVNNCILWGNMSNNGQEITLKSKLYTPYPSHLTILYSDVKGGLEATYVEEGCTLNWETGNIDADPCFVGLDYWDANGIWVNVDYHLLEDSPCINAGDPNHPYDPNETDLEGRPRVIGGRIDMGAYEYSPPIQAEVRIVPRTVNLQSKGKLINAFLWLPEGYDIADIDSYSLLLEDEIEPQWVWFDEEEQVAMVMFSRQEVQDIFTIGEVGVTITGRLTDGTIFEAKDVIIVIDKGSRKSAKQEKTK